MPDNAMPETTPMFESHCSPIGLVKKSRQEQEATGFETWDVFLSYATEDAEWVRLLVDRLKILALRVFDPYAAPSEFWGFRHAEILTAIFPTRCRAILVVLSSAYSTSERSATLAVMANILAVDRESAIVLPVRLDDSVVPEAVRSLASLDARGDLPELIAQMVVARLSAGNEAGKGTAQQPPSDSEEIERVKWAVETLPATDKRLISLYYLEGLTVSEVAASLDISSAVARMRLHRTLARLGNMIKAET